MWGKHDLWLSALFGVLYFILFFFFTKSWKYLLFGWFLIAFLWSSSDLFFFLLSNQKIALNRRQGDATHMQKGQLKKNYAPKLSRITWSSFNIWNNFDAKMRLYCMSEFTWKCTVVLHLKIFALMFFSMKNKTEEWRVVWSS